MSENTNNTDQLEKILESCQDEFVNIIIEELNNYTGVGSTGSHMNRLDSRITTRKASGKPALTFVATQARLNYLMNGQFAVLIKLGTKEDINDQENYIFKIGFDCEINEFEDVVLTLRSCNYSDFIDTQKITKLFATLINKKFVQKQAAILETEINLRNAKRAIDHQLLNMDWPGQIRLLDVKSLDDMHQNFLCKCELKGMTYDYAYDLEELGYSEPDLLNLNLLEFDVQFEIKASQYRRYQDYTISKNYLKILQLDTYPIRYDNVEEFLDYNNLTINELEVLTRQLAVRHAEALIDYILAHDGDTFQYIN